MMRISIKQSFYALISILLLVLVIFFSNIFSPDEISSAISKTGTLAPFLYLVVQIIGQVFAPLSTSTLFIAGYMMFGKIAILYAIITWLLSAIINFYIARKYGRRVIRYFVGEEGLLKVDGIAKRIETKQAILLRLTTFYISDFASYAFGLTKISFLTYYIATIISIIPWSILSFFILVKGDTVLTTLIKMVISMIPFALISYFYLKNKKKE